MLLTGNIFFTKRKVYLQKNENVANLPFALQTADHKSRSKSEQQNNPIKCLNLNRIEFLLIRR